MAQLTTPSRLHDAYAEALPGSHGLFERERRLFPDAVTHDNRRVQPFPLYVDRADGACKWDVDGNRYIDYWMGHGALLLGHNPPAVRDAVREQALRGTHYGACHPVEVEWGEWVRRLVPSAERVRFTASGTEASHMAVRLARAFTGRWHVVKFAGHFHGWHEGLEVGIRPPYEAEPEAGQPPEVVGLVSVLAPNDVEAVRRRLARGDVAAVILEPTGGHFGVVPTPAAFVEALCEETRRTRALLIFDEVVTGFRVAPGGAQAKLGVVPDLSILAKILASGLPGGAVADARRDGPSRHQGRSAADPAHQDRASGHLQRYPEPGAAPGPVDPGGTAPGHAVHDGSARIGNHQRSALPVGDQISVSFAIPRIRPCCGWSDPLSSDPQQEEAAGMAALRPSRRLVYAAAPCRTIGAGLAVREPEARGMPFRTMRTRLHLKPGQKGTKQLLAQFGDRLVCVRYRYDARRKKRFKTVELIVAQRDWDPPAPRFADDALVAVRVGFAEVELRHRVKQAGGK